MGPKTLESLNRNYNYDLSGINYIDFSSMNDVFDFDSDSAD